MTAEAGVKWLLRLIALTTIPAFIAAVMPQPWLVAMLHWAEPGLPTGLLVSYITRCLMGLYGVMGVQAVIWSFDVRRYRPLIVNLFGFAFIAALGGLIVLFTAQPPFEHTRVFWIVFIDLAEGLAHVTLVIILVLRVPAHSSPS